MLEELAVLYVTDYRSPILIDAPILVMMLYQGQQSMMSAVQAYTMSTSKKLSRHHDHLYRTSP
jgi:hypothetical protein